MSLLQILIVFATIASFIARDAAAAAAVAPAQSPPEICFWSPKATLELREKALARDPAVTPALDKLLATADEDLKLGPFSVTDKTLLPPSGDPHDFSTLGRYYWPNPNTKDGLPWIKQDGKTNPDYYNGKIGDSERFIRFVSSVLTLSRGYYLTGQETYAERATLLLKTWFIDPATRMNPNARYAARFPGNWDGQCYGIHGTRELMDIADAIGLLKGSAAWSAADQQAMNDWFTQYLTWLTQSDLGKQEGGQKNNHALAYDCLVVRLAIFTGQTELAHHILEADPKDRFFKQIEPDGKMPLELARATPWEYTRYAIEFLFKLGELGDRQGVDLWHARSDDGRGIRAALDYLMHSICKTDGSLNEDILKKADADRVGALLQVAAVVYKEPAYLDAMKRIGFNGDLTLQEASVNGQLGNESDR